MGISPHQTGIYAFLPETFPPCARCVSNEPVRWDEWVVKYVLVLNGNGPN